MNLNKDYTTFFTFKDILYLLKLLLK